MDRDAKALELAWKIVGEVYGYRDNSYSEFITSLGNSAKTDGVANVNYTTAKEYFGNENQAHLGDKDLKAIAEKWASLVNDIARTLADGLGEKG